MGQEKVIIAFENVKSCHRVRDLVESSGITASVIAHTAADVKRLANERQIGAVICGFKLPDQSGEELFDDLPSNCSMLMIAPQNVLDMCGNEDIFKLTTPVRRGDLISSVNMLLQMSSRMERFVKPRSCESDRGLINQAKSVLMARNAMTEEQAHRFLQKQSMDAGAKLAQTAQLIVDGL